MFWPALQDENEHDGNDADESNDRLPPALLDSILKIHCTHSEPDFLIPWQRQHQTTSTSSGFVIAMPNDDDSDDEPQQLRVMTNAHSVEYGSIVQVQRRGDDTKYPATVETLANACDLAILRIDDPSFWSCSQQQQLSPLPLGTSLPQLQENVQVVGYPTGGDALSVTQGVVSRLEQLEYTQACTRLLAIQIDAAINAGNSGGPVVNQDMQVTGVAFQGLDGAENIGYVVPITVVQHVLHDIQRNGKYTGFCSLGIGSALLENKAFRKSLGMKDGQSGIMVREIPESSLCHGILQPNDVICEVDGIPVSNDGKIPFRPGERVSLSCYIQTKFVGDTVTLRLWRNQTTSLLQKVPVGFSQRMVPSHWGDDRPPPYLIVAGLVFTALSVPYLHASNAWESYCSDAISYLLGKWYEPRKKKNDQIVILAQVLAHEGNLGYDHYTDLHVVRLNGQEIRSLQHLQDLLSTTTETFLRFECAQPGHEVIVMEQASIQQATDDVCEEHSIAKSYFLHGDDDEEEERSTEEELMNGDGVKM